MKLSLGALLLSASSGGAAAFAPPSSSRRNNGRVWQQQLAMSSADGGGAAPQKKVLTAADVMAKSKSSPAASSGGNASADPAAPGAQEAPKIFSEAIYDDFQSSLLLLEKYVKDGAGSLSQDEVAKFEEETGRIVKEMREYMADPEGCGERIRKGYESKVEIDVTAEKIKEGKHIYMEPEASSTKPAIEPTIAAYDSPPKLQPPPPATTAASTTATAPPPSSSAEVGPEDGPSEDSVTFGVARGTTNTYVIPGMEEMSPEEYRAKLQETVSAHQAVRRRQSLAANKGIIGNASSQGYLDSLGGGNKQGEIHDEIEDSVAISSDDEGDASKRSIVSGNESAIDDKKIMDDLIEQQKRRQERLQNEHARLGEVQTFAKDDGEGTIKAVQTRVAADDEPASNDTKTDDATSATKPKLLEEEQIARVEARIAKEEERQQWLEEQNQLVKERLEARYRMTEAMNVEEKLNSLSTSEDEGDGTSGQEADEGAQEDVTEKAPIKSPFATFKQSKLELEQSRKAEWLGDDDATASNPVSKMGGRFKMNQQALSVDEIQVVDVPAVEVAASKEEEEVDESPKNKQASNDDNDDDGMPPTDQELLQTSLDQKTLPNSPASSLTGFNKEDWWGNQQKRQRPVPDSDKRGKGATFFGRVHQASPLTVDKSFEASQKVSKESTQSFVHNPERESATFFSRVHQMSSASNDKSFEASKKVSKEMTQSFVHGNEGENSQRPPSTMSMGKEAQSKNVRVSDYRGQGDVRESSMGTKQASQKVSSESTRSFVHGNEEKSQRPVTPMRASDEKTSHVGIASDHRGPGDVRSANTGRSTAGGDDRSGSALKSLVDIEERVRPVPSTDRPEYIKVLSDHRGVGDRREGKNSPSPLKKSSISSLVETEERIRPSPSTNTPEYAQISNHRSVGDTRENRSSATMASPASTARSLVEIEERIRPTPLSSDVPAHAQVKDQRSVGDTRRQQQQSSVHAATVSLVQTEGRVRPVVKSSNVPEYTQIRDRRSVGDVKDPERRKMLQHEATASKSLIEKEERARPIASSRNYQHGFAKAADHRGPGDENTLTKGVRATKKESPAPVTATSLSEAEQRVRPSPAYSGQSPNIQVSDHRGPGDNNAMTKRNMESTSSAPTSPRAFVSLSEAETRVRPTPYSSQSQNVQVNDYRGVGDTKALTKKNVQSSAAVTSLSEGEQRQRPIVTSGGSGQSRAVDHRDPGDTRTLTKKVQSSFASSSGVSSLIEDEVRLRPVPPSSRNPQKNSSENFRDDSDSESQSLSQRDEVEEHWWDEQTQRRPIHSTKSSGGNLKVLNRAADDSQKQAAKQLSDPPPPQSSSPLKSLLKEDEKPSVSEKKKAAVAAKPPIAVIQPSSLQSLLKDDSPVAGTEENAIKKPADGYQHTGSATSSSRLASLLTEKKHQILPRSKRNTSAPPSNEMEWWNEKPRRPQGYVKHHQPMSTSYVKKFEPPRDYGDVVTALTEDDGSNDEDSAAEEVGIGEI